MGEIMKNARKSEQLQRTQATAYAKGGDKLGFVVGLLPDGNSRGDPLPSHMRRTKRVLKEKRLLGPYERVR